MDEDMGRRDFLKLMGIGGVVFMSGLSPQPAEALSLKGESDFFFVQLSDSHWGFEGDKINPDARGTLIKAVKEVNALRQKPDFIVFTGDLTQTTDDKNVRQKRMQEFRSIVADLDCKNVYFMPGEHDASLDRGETYKDFFGKTHYVFDHKGVHFIALDNVSDPSGSIGDEQLEWLKTDLARLKPRDNIVVLTHRPLFDLYPRWDWATRDGARAIEMLMPFQNVTVFYGHIHQENHTQTGHINHHAATSLMLPMPAPGSQPKRTPLAWDASAPYKGLGFREVRSQTKRDKYELNQFPINEAAKI